MLCIFFSFNNSCFLCATLCTQASQFCFNYLLRLYFEVKFINQGFSDIPVDYLLAHLLRLNPLALSIPSFFSCVSYYPSLKKKLDYEIVGIRLAFYAFF